MKRLYVLSFCCVFALLAGCPSDDSSAPPEPSTEEQSTVTAEEVHEKLDEAAEAVKQYSDQEMDKAVEDARAHLGDIRQRIDSLQGEIGDMQDTAQHEYDQRLKELQTNLREAEQRFETLRAAGSDAWEQSRDDLQESLSNLESAYKDAANAFKTATPEKRDKTPPEEAGNAASEAAVETTPSQQEDEPAPGESGDQAPQ